ncbi:hypothetical protein K461DRAFT_266279 [Myriangium duriaei CBS 260.36]|uniref:RED-like N-terminal domain-containing protein n=1 Tax=Myriangium duriaei CBS 260.36 TaxID=1168546 RepID=A0A9P4J9K0_9PEZI|nr:hypothetical protein K461DRAFT_266279 [Myriangium duriaei CBS 260.36]
MNNDQFRRLLLSSGDNKTNSSQNGPSGSPPSGSGSTLGSRKSSFVPRNVQRGNTSSAGADYVRQASERNSAQQKKFKSSGPRGVKVAKGYQDRALERLNTDAEQDKEDENETAVKLKGLAAQVMEGKLEMAEFEKIRAEMAGGDVGSTHLVRGLDRKLLEKVRRGEDVLGASDGVEPSAKDDIDDELDEFGSKEVQTVEKQEKVKKGEAAAVQPPPAVAGVKRSRDDILKELKAQRQAEAQAKIAARPELGDKFKAIESADKPKIIIDKKGREVIITRDENGKVKKKVRKVASVPEPAHPEPEKPVAPEEQSLVPASQVEVDDNKSGSEPEAMFDDAGSDYNPFAGMDDDGDASSGDDDGPREVKAKTPTKAEETSQSDASEGAMDEGDRAFPSKTAAAPAGPRNYFSTGQADAAPDDVEPDTNPFADPSFLSAITRAAAEEEAGGNDGQLSTGPGRYGPRFWWRTIRR